MPHRIFYFVSRKKNPLKNGRTNIKLFYDRARNYSIETPSHSADNQAFLDLFSTCSGSQCICFDLFSIFSLKWFSFNPLIFSFLTEKNYWFSVFKLNLHMVKKNISFKTILENYVSRDKTNLPLAKGENLIIQLVCYCLPLYENKQLKDY